MVDVMKRVEDNSYLEQRGRVWWYNRRVPRNFAQGDLSPEDAWAWSHYEAEKRPVLLLCASNQPRRMNAEAAGLIGRIDQPIEQLCMPSLGRRAEQINLRIDGEIHIFALHWPDLSIPVVCLSDVTEEVEHARKLAEMVDVGVLTGAASRVRFERELSTVSQNKNGDYTIF